MIYAISDWIRFNFWLGLLGLAAGLIIAMPFWFSKSFRTRFLRSNYELEIIGIIALVVAIFVIGIYNHFGTSGA